MEQGLVAIGIKPGADFNSSSLSGSSWVPTTIRPSRESRDCSESSCLSPTMSKTGIIVYVTTMGKKFLFKNTNVAGGLQVQQVGITWTLNARKEVIISAGTFQSLQFLIVSGIGPSATLKSLGIKVISDLASVGQNM